MENDIKPIDEKLDDKIKKLNSSRVFKKITPKGDLSWYIKWASSMVLILCMASASANLYPWNLYFGMIGVAGWFWVGVLWHDRALIMLNAVSFTIYLIGIINYFAK